MATFYGVHPDIPGFHYYSRERQGDIHFPRSGHATWVETRHASGRRGILQGGSAYGCCFTGGADNNLFTFTSLTKPSGRGVLSALSPFVVVTWVAAKNLVLTVYEDRGGAIWIGTFGGLDRFDPAARRFVHHRAGRGETGGPSSDTVWPS